MKNTPLFQGGQNFDSEFWIHLRISNKVLAQMTDMMKGGRSAVGQVVTVWTRVGGRRRGCMDLG